MKRLSAYYDIQAINVNNYPYPYNVVLSDWDISRKMRRKGRYRELKLEETDDLKITLSVKETINTGSDLYYIPLASLYKCLQDENNTCAKLLLGVCVYLYRKAGVCHYRDSESYICYLYDIMDNWIEDDRESMDDADYKEQRANLDEMFAIGDKLEVILGKEEHLLQLQTIIKTAEAKNQFEKACVKLAKETLAIWMEFPYANLYQHITQNEEDDEDDYYGDGKIQVTDYISFIGETSGNVYETMINMTNDDFNERSGVQDFEATVVFDKAKGKYKDELAYEGKVIAIIDELCNLLNELP
ncbi:hypothetical protein [Mucilaginibacter sp. L196]|uniref:hypothetical protein n=1 Tax=Mucilaginibacter sp. L196 TaxID=1641870 RepID=UPI00131A976F|nr:hypothetical protein [Mucilaginibacter sp. L196]